MRNYGSHVPIYAIMAYPFMRCRPFMRFCIFFVPIYANFCKPADHQSSQDLHFPWPFFLQGENMQEDKEKDRVYLDNVEVATSGSCTCAAVCLSEALSEK